MTQKLYCYVLASSSLKPTASLASFVSGLQDAGIEVVNYDEETRRVLHRVPAPKLHYAKSLWDRFAQATTLEFKASGNIKRVKASVLRRFFPQVDETPSALLIMAPCSKGFAVFVEIKGRRANFKLCRGSALNQPVTQVAPSLCIFIYPEVDPVEYLEIARECFNEVYARLLELASSEGRV